MEAKLFCCFLPQAETPSCFAAVICPQLGAARTCLLPSRSPQDAPHLSNHPCSFNLHSMHSTSLPPPSYPALAFFLSLSSSELAILPNQPLSCSHSHYALDKQSCSFLQHHITHSFTSTPNNQPITKAVMRRMRSNMISFLP